MLWGEIDATDHLPFRDPNLCHHTNTNVKSGGGGWSRAHEGEFAGCWVHAVRECWKPRHLEELASA